MWKVLLTALFFISVALVVTNLDLVTASAQDTKEQPAQLPNLDLVTASAHATKEATKEQPTSSPPPRPTWIDADGKLIRDKAPREVPAIGVGSGGKAYEKTVPSLMDALPPAPVRDLDLVTASAHATKEATKEQPTSSPPPRPTWIDADGKLIRDKAPREVPAIGVGSGGKAYEKTVPSLMDALPPAPVR